MIFNRFSIGKAHVLASDVLPESAEPCDDLRMSWPQVRGSLRRLGTEYVDVLTLSWNDFSDRGYIDVARRLGDLQASGLVRHLAVTNFDVPHLIKLLDAEVKPVMNQVWEEGDLATMCGRPSVQVLSAKGPGFRRWSCSGNWPWSM